MNADSIRLEPHIVAVPDLMEGMTFYGPFGDKEEALRYAERFGNVAHWIKPLRGTGMTSEADIVAIARADYLAKRAAAPQT